MPEITHFCAWCESKVQVDGKWVPGEKPGGLISHGMCPECYKKMMGEDPEGEDNE